jgi:hypothetical protein
LTENVTTSTSAGRAGRFLQRGPAATTAIFAALAAALGFLLIGVPNVELLTFTVFAAGVVLGRLRGAVAGVLAMAIYSGLNPYGSGAAIPTLFLSQLVAAAVTGMAGGMASSLWRQEDPGRRWMQGALICAIIGLVLTVAYQAAVIVGISAMSPEFRTGAVAVIVSNAFFSLVHIVSNTAIFAVAGPALLPRIARLAVGRSARPQSRGDGR